MSSGTTRLPAIAAPATTTASATATTAAAISAATASRTAFRFRARFINIQRASAQLRSIERRDGFLSVFVARHLDESEATRTPGLAIRKNTHAINLPVGLEQLT